MTSEQEKTLDLAKRTLSQVNSFAVDSSLNNRAKALNSARLLVQELEDDDAAMLRRIEQVCAAQVLKFVMYVLLHRPSALKVDRSRSGLLEFSSISPKMTVSVQTSWQRPWDASPRL